MSDITSPLAGQTSALPSGLPAFGTAPVLAERKALDLAVLKRGAKDYLDFLDTTKEIFYAYLYHRTGSTELAKTLLSEMYLDVLVRAMSLWWFGTLSIKLLLDGADKALRDRGTQAADLDTVYIPSLAWLNPEERQSVMTLHDALWSLPLEAERLLIFSLFLGFTDERITQLLHIPIADVTTQLATAKEFLLMRWQPTSSVATKLDSLIFVPALDIQNESTIRFSIVEKYNALRFRRYQWVILGGLFAVMSNVIVASFLAFVVITAPPTSLRETRSQVASLDAVLLKRQIAINQAKVSVVTLSREAQRLAAYEVSRDLNTLGVAYSRESRKAQEQQEATMNNLIKLIERAEIAMAPFVKPIVQFVLHDLNLMFGWL